MKRPALHDWMPARIFWQDGQAMLDWFYLGEGRFSEPFFEDTLRKSLRRPFSALFRHTTALATLSDDIEVEAALAPSGFIFHMSRCGSTLLSQLLAALPHNIVISEAGPIDSILRASPPNAQFSDEERIAWLRTLISSYARPRYGEQHFFVKFDCWHTRALPLIQRAFPEVPWIFVIRDPVQVLVSHSRQPGAQMVPSLVPPAWLGLDWSNRNYRSTTDYHAQVLARICEAAYANLNQCAQIINYQQLPSALFSTIADHFGLSFSQADQEWMQQAGQFNAKNPRLFFVDDTSDKIRAASENIRQAAERWIQPIYNSLETHRIQAQGRTERCSTK